MTQISRLSRCDGKIRDYIFDLSDPVPWLRERAIESLEKIADTRPAVIPKVIDALKANVDSADKSLQTICKAKLKRYNGKLKMD